VFYFAEFNVLAFHSLFKFPLTTPTTTFTAICLGTVESTRVGVARTFRAATFFVNFIIYGNFHLSPRLPSPLL